MFVDKDNLPGQNISLDLKIQILQGPGLGAHRVFPPGLAQNQGTEAVKGLRSSWQII